MTNKPIKKAPVKSASKTTTKKTTAKTTKKTDIDKDNEILAQLREMTKDLEIESLVDLEKLMFGGQGQGFADLAVDDAQLQAQELVMEAYGLPPSKAKAKINKALKLDPNCVDAYVYLGNVEYDIDKAIEFFEQAVVAAHRTLGEEFFISEKGFFWGMHETRPYMRAKASLAMCLNDKGEKDKAIEIYREMLELNPNDNQGVRYLLANALLETNDLQGFATFAKDFMKDDGSPIWYYSNALYHFKKYGNSVKSNKVLEQAAADNPHVLDYMLGIKELPDEMPALIQPGGESEAVSYVYEVWDIWRETDGAFDWLFELRIKQEKQKK